MFKINIFSPISFYRNFISPLFPPTCKFTPTCSAYMMQAVKKRGIFIGTGIGIWRILRCNPFSKGGFDPILNNYKGNAKWIL